VNCTSRCGYPSVLSKAPPDRSIGAAATRKAFVSAEPYSRLVPQSLPELVEGFGPPCLAWVAEEQTPSLAFS